MQQDGVNLPQGSINFASASPGVGRTTSNANFAAQLKNAMGQGLAASSRGFNYVAPMVPGGAVMSAMLGGAANVALNGAPGPVTPGALGAGVPDFVKSMEGMQQSMASTNMNMIALQTQSQQMNIEFTTHSNILKAKHDTQKNSISNIR